MKKSILLVSLLSLGLLASCGNENNKEDFPSIPDQPGGGETENPDQPGGGEVEDDLIIKNYSKEDFLGEIEKAKSAVDTSKATGYKLTYDNNTSNKTTFAADENTTQKTTYTSHTKSTINHTLNAVENDSKTVDGTSFYTYPNLKDYSKTGFKQITTVLEKSFETNDSTRAYLDQSNHYTSNNYIDGSIDPNAKVDTTTINKFKFQGENDQLIKTHLASSHEKLTLYSFNVFDSLDSIAGSEVVPDKTTYKITSSASLKITEYEVVYNFTYIDETNKKAAGTMTIDLALYNGILFKCYYENKVLVEAPETGTTEHLQQIKFDVAVPVEITFNENDEWVSKDTYEEVKPYGSVTIQRSVIGCLE